MNNYTVEIKETIYHYVDVEAENENEAVDKAYEECDFSDNDYYESNAKIYEE